MFSDDPTHLTILHKYDDTSDKPTHIRGIYDNLSDTVSDNPMQQYVLMLTHWQFEFLVHLFITLLQMLATLIFIQT